MFKESFVRFILLLLVQVLILNNIHLYHFVTPLIYIYFIIKLPFDIPGWLLLLLAFLIGFLMDIFVATPGLHASATVFAAFIRPLIIRLMRSGRDYEPGLVPGIRDMGPRWFIGYSIIIVAVQVAAITFLENLGSSDYTQIFYRWFYSTLVSFTMILILDYLFLTKKKKGYI